MVGRLNYSITAQVIANGTDTSGGGGSPYYLNQTQTDAKDNAYVFGYVVGLGMDVALLPNVFLHGEWDYMGFVTISNIHTSINTARVGLGILF